MLNGLIVGEMERAIERMAGGRQIAELRLRAGKPLIIFTVDGARRISPSYIVGVEDIEGIISRATDLSPYSVSDEIKRGYIPFKSARIGVGGEGVNDGDKLIGVKNIAYMTVRIPHQVRSAADKILPYVLLKNGVYQVDNDISSAYFDNYLQNLSGGKGEDGFTNAKVLSTLILSPPGAGKTTILRELARTLSYIYNVAVIDERCELAGAQGGCAALDVGYADVISGINKTVAYQNCVRAMAPDIIVLDELFGAEEADAVEDIVRCGIKVFASVHSDSVERLESSRVFGRLIGFFDLAVTLAPVGILREARKL